MAKALIVFESIFGDNKLLARAIGRGLSARLEVEIRGVEEAPQTVPDDIDLLVAGGPTHMTQMSRPTSRKQVPEHKEGTPVPDSGIREWLTNLPKDKKRGLKAVAFGTNIGEPSWVKMAGKAAKGIHRRLRRKGFEMVASPEIFLVADPTGPLIEGEEERAERLGEQLAAKFEPHRPRPGAG